MRPASRNAKLRAVRRSAKREAAQTMADAERIAQSQAKPQRGPSQKILTIYAFPQGHRTILGTAVFNRTNGHWRCIAADPTFDWMTRVNHVELIEQWIRLHGYHPVWTDPQQDESNRTDASGQHKNPAQTEEGLKPAILKHGGTTPSLKNDTNPDQQCSSPASGLLERNGVTASSPLNCPGTIPENSEPPSRC